VGLILDTSVLIQGERSGLSALEVLSSLMDAHAGEQVALSVITIAELTHGIYRSPSEARSQKRRRFIQELQSNLTIHPLTLEIATLTGRIEGEQAAQGIAIAFQDLVIGATALHLDHAVLTTNTKHFALIPGLNVLPF
jgi:predicted nucleic acid-binding protein